MRLKQWHTFYSAGPYYAAYTCSFSAAAIDRIPISGRHFNIAHISTPIDELIKHPYSI